MLSDWNLWILQFTCSKIYLEVPSVQFGEEESHYCISSHYNIHRIIFLSFKILKEGERNIPTININNMALDLSMNSSRPRPLPSGPPSPIMDMDTPLALVTKKRVRFQDCRSPRAYHPYSHPHRGSEGCVGATTGRGWTGVLVQVGDSDEENRPPSSASSDSTSSDSTSSITSSVSLSSIETPSSCDRLSGSPDSLQGSLHPAAMTGHVTVATSRDDTVLRKLPSDPREWSRADVGAWLQYMKTAHHLTQLQPERFLMNGKALCLMNPAMFSYRVPAGGKLLYRDFRTRLSHALQQDSVVPTTTTSVTMSVQATRA